MNPRHKAYESSALPTELPRRYFKPQNGTMLDQFCQLFDPHSKRKAVESNFCKVKMSYSKEREQKCLQL